MLPAPSKLLARNLDMLSFFRMGFVFLALLRSCSAVASLSSDDVETDCLLLTNFAGESFRDVDRLESVDCSGDRMGDGVADRLGDRFCVRTVDLTSCDFEPISEFSLPERVGGKCLCLDVTRDFAVNS